jgi:hypothetical protein
MTLTKSLNWYIIIGSSTDKQLAYFIERPKYSFPKIIEKRGSKVILLPNKNPVWSPIALEVPIKTLISTNTWLEEKSKRDLLMCCVDQDGHLIEEWQVKGVTIIGQMKKRSRCMDAEVLSIMLKYEWARRSK